MSPTLRNFLFGCIFAAIPTLLGFWLNSLRDSHSNTSPSGFISNTLSPPLSTQGRDDSISNTPAPSQQDLAQELFTSKQIDNIVKQIVSFVRQNIDTSKIGDRKISYQNEQYYLPDITQRLQPVSPFFSNTGPALCENFKILTLEALASVKIIDSSHASGHDAHLSELQANFLDRYHDGFSGSTEEIQECYKATGESAIKLGLDLLNTYPNIRSKFIQEGKIKNE